MIKEFENYLRYVKGYSENTTLAYGKDLRDFAHYMLSTNNGATWRNVDASSVQNYVTWLKANGKESTTIKRHVSAIRSLYKYMRTQGMIIENPAKYTQTPKAAKTLPNTIETSAIVEAIINPVEPLRIRTMLSILLETGIRLQEMIDMSIQDIDTYHKSIRIKGKGNKERIVYYNKYTEALLDVYAKTVTGRLFPHSQRSIRHDIWTTLRRYTTATQLSPHAIRHTYATSMLENGADIKAIAELMGHDSVKTTERYVHLSHNTIRTQYNMFNPTNY